ncbi:recombinase family protein [Streptomyces chartreusis]|uniref:recombinase family protein n=1 Tax=Streptomyces chartreusis TaxID=1969 RepID=UPI0036A75464
MTTIPAEWADTEGPLGTFPASPSGARVGYARVSTKGQLLDRQIAALTAAGCVRVFSDKKSGKDAEREELRAALDYLRPGDTLVVPSLDRLGRSIQDLISIVGGLRQRDIGFQSLHEALDTTTPGGRLVFHVFAALAEFIRELIVQGTHEGLEAARARGERIGRPPAMTEEQIRHARALLVQPENTVTSIAKLLGVSRTTLYKYVPELRVGRDALVSGDRGPALPGPR